MKIKCKLIVVVFALLLVLALISFSILWFLFFNTGNLTFYNFEPIDKIYAYEDVQYLITEDGYGYVTGGWSSSYSSKKYRNVEGKRLKNTNLSVPVRIFDKKIIHISPFPCGVCIITDENELFFLTNENSIKIAEQIQDVVYLPSAQQFLVIDTQNILSLINLNGETHKLKDAVKQIVVYQNQVFLLDLQGNLISGILDASQRKIISEEILHTNVLSFDIDDCSSHYEGEKFVTSESPLTYKNALFVVLLNNGEIYCRGLYHPYMGHHQLLHYSEIVEFSDWMLIGTNIESFSSSAMGTLMIDVNGKTTYFGYDTTRKDWIGLIELDISSSEYVVSENAYVCIKLKSGEWLFWGDSWQNQFCGINQKNHTSTSIKKDSPAVFN